MQKHIELSHHLVRERRLEIERLAIYPVFIRVNHDKYYLQMDQASFQKYTLIAKGISWEMFRDQRGNWLGPTKVKIMEDQHGIYLKDKKYISPNAAYMMVPFNSTINKQLQGLRKVHLVDQDIYQFIIDPYHHTIGDEIIPFDEQLLEGLNKYQKEAVRLAMKKKVAVIKGPPGTGKTTVVSKLVEMIQRQKMKILLCAPSNVAIDTTTRYILKMKSVQDITRFCYTADLPSINFSNKLIKIITKTRDKQFASWFEDILNKQLDHHDIVYDDKFTADDYKKARQQATIEVLTNTQVLCTTTTSCGMRILQTYQPDVLIVDQASQIIDPGILIPLTKGVKKVILLGDDLQLSPTVISNNPTLKQTMFYRINDACPRVSAMLTIQYRMHPVISAFCSKQFYDGRLSDDPSTNNRHSPYQIFDECPILIVDSREPEMKVEHSYYNTKEADIIADLIKGFREEDLPRTGVITGFVPQHQLLCQKLKKQIQLGLEVKTFDGFQGNQKQYILISFVRSNPQNEIGFLSDANRTNVALSRARSGIVLVGNIQTMTANSIENPWREFVKYVEECNEKMRPKHVIASHEEFPSLTPQIEPEIEKEAEIPTKQEQFPDLSEVTNKKQPMPKGRKKRKGKGQPFDIWN